MRRTYGRREWEHALAVPVPEKPILSAAGRASKLVNKPKGTSDWASSVEIYDRWKRSRNDKYWIKKVAWG